MLLLVALFDWNWFRPSFERYLADKSHRVVTIGDLHLSLASPLEPTLRLRKVYVQNAPWGSARPLATAGEVSFTFLLRSLGTERLVVTRLLLVDADVSLERQADGLRNWRLTRPDDRGPGRISVQTLEARHSKLRFLHQGLDLDVAFAASPAEAAEKASNGDPLPTRIDFEGHWRRADFRGQALTSDVLSLRDTGRPFPLRGHLDSGSARLDADGRAADILIGSTFDGHLSLGATSLADLQPWILTTLPSTRRVRLDADLHKEASRYAFSKLAARVGNSDLGGELSIEPKDERTQLRASLQSALIDFDDLGRTDKPPVQRLAAQRAAASASANAVARQNGHPPGSAGSLAGAGSVSPKPGGGLDLGVELKVGRLKAHSIPALQGLQLQAALVDGVLALTAIDLGIAGGHATGSVRLDWTQPPVSIASQIELRRVQIDKLIPAQRESQRVTGQLDGQLQLQSRGSTLAAWQGATSGSFKAALHGGTIANLLDAKLALNGGQALRAVVGGAEQIPIHCAAIDLDIRHGAVTSRTLVLETAKTRVSGRGTVDLRGMKLDLLLTPMPKEPGLFSLSRSIRVSGQLGQKLAFALAQKAEPAPSSACRSGKA